MAPADELAHGIARAEHTDDNDGRGNERRAADFFELIEAELQTEGEEQENYADFGPGVDVRAVGNRGKKVEVRTGDETGDDVAEYERLINFFEKNGRHTGDEQNHG